MSTAAVQISGLRKEYGTVIAVDGIDLSIDAGAFVGLVGHNGAGKTTTIRMLSGQLSPTAGSVFVAGTDVIADPAAARVKLGKVPEHPRLYE